VSAESKPGAQTVSRTDATEPLAGGDMTLMEHLTELRTRLIISVLAVATGMLIVFIFYDTVFDWLVRPYCESSDDGECRLLQTDPLEGFGVRMRVAGYGGIALAMPVLLWQLWRFVSPGLYSNEKRYALPFVGSALTLFAFGAGLAYWTMPKALDFLADIGGDNLDQFYSPAKYFRLITYMMLAFGIGFEFPILLVFLQLAGLLQADSLRRARRYAIVGIVILVAVITPSGDPYSMLALSVPMVVFYEVSVLIGRLIERRRTAAAARP
jgi:sec-independent protein translocase protein TatC